MTEIVCAAGIDVGRDHLDVAMAPSGRWFRAPNAPKGIEVIVDRLRRAGVGRVVLESIGPLAARLVRALAEAGFALGVVDPKRIKALRLAEGTKAKTDRLDARLIARGALLSLVFNRGAAFRAAGDRFSEMREIRAAMQGGMAA